MSSTCTGDLPPHATRPMFSSCHPTAEGSLRYRPRILSCPGSALSLPTVIRTERAHLYRPKTHLGKITCWRD